MVCCRYFFLRRGQRPAVLQKLIDVRKRLRDPPTSGPVSIVVTDVEGFSGDVEGFSGGVEGFSGDELRGDSKSLKLTNLQGVPLCNCQFLRNRISPSDLMKASPELMMPALITHNNLLQKAKYTNFGYTLEQEGDSYSIMFHEAIEAVKFCLQVGH